MDAEKTGRFIAGLRKERSLTQLQLAQLLHVSDKAVSKWETGRGFPDLNSLEALGDTLEVSVAELLKGERFPEVVPTQEVRQISAEGLSLTRRLLQKRRVWTFLSGALLGFLLLVLLVVHLTSPIYVADAENALTVESLSDGRIVAVLKDTVAGCEMQRVTDPDTGASELELSCYRTLWSRLTGSGSETIVVLGDGETLGNVWYYPTVEGDQRIYAPPGAAPENGGRVTLPRLVYNFWLVLGWFLTLLGFGLFLLLRKKRCADLLWKLALLPLSGTLAIHLCLIGRSGQIYNAPFYLTGIGLTAALLYGLFLLLTLRFKAKKT